MERESSSPDARTTTVYSLPPHTTVNEIDFHIRAIFAQLSLDREEGVCCQS